ncbi:hypothetical protein FBEOM_9862 [Fusarium beomiforme]|uniref:Uncharacterized protein n=1 Tax=Fusarium beomiforme TaxID=44412 RepID=A0A9P5AE60_9HYPO|nr:hypothetical protein FBEOM_9862 [Fusarium beomiforme]
MAKALKSNGSQVFFCSTRNLIELWGHKDCRPIRPVTEPQPRAGGDKEDADTSKYYFFSDDLVTALADFPALLRDDIPLVHWVYDLPFCCGCPGAYRRARQKVEDKREEEEKKRARRERREAKWMRETTGSTQGGLNEQRS